MKPTAPDPWTGEQVREALGLPRSDDGDRVFPRIGTDTRTLGEGDLFVALAGPRFDGHDFLSEAAARGAGGAVVHRSGPSDGLLPLYPVDDTLVALGDLARYRRRRLKAEVVAITGSSGKTTVKELLGAALAAMHRVHATRGNLNNRIGLPLTLLAAPPDADVVVAEIGTNEPGEIAILTAITEPDLAVVTTVSEAHLEKLGSLEGVFEEKLSLLEGVAAVVVGDEPPELPRRARSRHPGCVVAGLSPRADERWRGELVDVDPKGRWSVHLPGVDFRCGIPGRHGATNALIALVTAERLGVSPAEGARKIEAVSPAGMRGEERTVGDLTLVLDCYNANPQSTRAALALLGERPHAGDRVAVLGSMLELGDRAPALHREILGEAMGSGASIVVAVGEFATAAADVEPDPAGPALLAAEDAGEAFELLLPRLRGDELVLLKGSRGVRLETMVPRFEEEFGGGGEA